MTFSSEIAIENRLIGRGRPVFIIAEAGVNHNGNLSIAKRMIDAAASCGVDCVKFQTFRTEEFLADRNMTYSYKVRGRTVQENMFSMFKRLELRQEWHGELFAHVREQGIVPLTSVADIESADIADQAGAAAYKLSSEDLINLPLIENLARRGKPILLSTGMANREELDDAVEILARSGMADIVMLHCVSLYPAGDGDIHLARMQAISGAYNVLTGYSDHSSGLVAALGAVVLGACVIEKHFTLDRKMGGPDHAFSADPREMKRLVRSIRRLEKMKGQDSLEPSASEMELRKVFRRSIVAAQPLRSGHILGQKDLTAKRPGTGLKAREMGGLIGRRLIRNIDKDELIRLGDVE